jgi:hypothetical protein
MNVSSEKNVHIKVCMGVQGQCMAWCWTKLHEFEVCDSCNGIYQTSVFIMAFLQIAKNAVE